MAKWEALFQNLQKDGSFKPVRFLVGLLFIVCSFVPLLRFSDFFPCFLPSLQKD
jgi:hypothetical protein